MLEGYASVKATVRLRRAWGLVATSSIMPGSGREWEATAGGTELTDRRVERHVLDRLAEAVRAGHSRVLVMRGDPGVGKAVLLDYLAGRASDSECRGGVRSERAVGGAWQGDAGVCET